MQIQSLRVYCDLVDSCSFSEAARRNGVTQSAVSQQIRAMEKKYGVIFFERGSKSFAVTAEGEAFHECAVRIVAEFEGIDDKLRTLRSEVAGNLRVATVSSIGLHDLPPIARQFEEAFPEVKLAVSYGSYEDVYDDVGGGKADVGIVAYPTRRSGLIYEEFAVQPLVMVCSPGHELVKGGGSIPFSMLNNEPMIAFEPDVPTRKAVEQLLRGAGVEINAPWSFDDAETVKRAVQVTGAVAILPGPSVSIEVAEGRLCLVPLEGISSWTRPLAVIRRQPGVTTTAMREFMTILGIEEERFEVA
jgi:LysR family transcriptional regulator, transcriptional activator of the cysJI operon